MVPGKITKNGIPVDFSPVDGVGNEISSSYDFLRKAQKTQQRTRRAMPFSVLCKPFSFARQYSIRNVSAIPRVK